MNSSLSPQSIISSTSIQNSRELIHSQPQDVISFDRVGKAPGRGAYICRRVECLNKAVKIHALERQLECRIDQTVFEQLARELQEDEA